MRSKNRGTNKVTRAFAWTFGIAVLFAAAVFVAFQVSPWPGVLMIRHSFGEGGAKSSRALANHVPPGVSERLDLRYDAASDDAYLDVFYPYRVENSDTLLTTVVWVHGGGFVAGSKGEIANYLRVLAGRGVTAVGVEYTTAPEAKYPTPVRQTNAALAYLLRHAKKLHVDPTRIVLAGDSGGAHIVAQLAAATTDSSYARALGIEPTLAREHLAGTILFCGPYDLARVNFNGPFGGFLKTVLWAYIGRKDFLDAPRIATFSVLNWVTPRFPPTFISVGNADPLAPQSQALADALVARGVAVDALFFPADHTPALGHEYQFDLDTEAGALALERVTAFVRAR